MQLLSITRSSQFDRLTCFPSRACCGLNICGCGGNLPAGRLRGIRDHTSTVALHECIDLRIRDAYTEVMQSTVHELVWWTPDLADERPTRLIVLPAATFRPRYKVEGFKCTSQQSSSYSISCWKQHSVRTGSAPYGSACIVSNPQPLVPELFHPLANGESPGWDNRQLRYW